MDIHAKRNIEWTDSHAQLFDRNGITNIASVLVECKHLKFPTSEQIEKAEKDIAKLFKQKDKFIYNPARSITNEKQRKRKKK